MLIVVKVGGRSLQKNLSNIVKSVAIHSRHHEIVLIHGGGDVVTKYCIRLGIEPRFVVSPSGIRSRYTDEDELEIYVMVMAGKINKEIVAKLQILGIKAIGLSGVDASILKAERKERIVIIDERGRKRIIPGGYTGKIIEVNDELIRYLIMQGYVVVIAPLAYGLKGELLNVDGDQAAYRIATALKADMLILLSDVEGVYLGDSIIERISVDEVERLYKDIGYGMRRKVMMAARAIREGVADVIIASGLSEDPIGDALNNAGTVIE
jgi:acetylglutamate/LysW-gamma-L-alpha-aminoadipate kinase